MKNNKIKLNNDLMKEDKIMLDCGHKSNSWITTCGKKICFPCYKRGKFRELRVEKMSQKKDNNKKYKIFHYGNKNK